MEPGERQARMERLADEPDGARRRLLALGLLTDRLAEVGIEPILVGGAALELYTAGGYATGDVDLALPNVPAVDEAFAELGFRKQGRFWIREELDLYFEAPAPAGLPGEDAPRTIVEIEGLRVVVIGIEDLLLDRIRAAVRLDSEDDRRWARRLALLHADRLDWRYLTGRAAAVAAERELVGALRREAGQ
jgi:predicted nucleotidyltransferase